MRKILPYIALFSVVIVISISIMFNQSKTIDKFIYYYGSYNITTLVDEDNFLNINLYVNNDKSYFVDKYQINECYIQNIDSIIDLEINNIYNTKEVVKYKNTNYYKFIYKFKVLFNTTEEIKWNLNDVTLYLRYNDNKEYNLNIGDISINKINDNDTILAISNIKPLTSVINNNTILTGLIIGVRNSKENNSIIINKISVLDANISVGNKIEILNDIPKTNSFNEVSNYNYSSIKKGEEEVNIKVTNASTYLFIPIFYNNVTVASKFPIEISYIYNNDLYRYVLYDYTFYEPINVIINDNNLIICEIK